MSEVIELTRKDFASDQTVRWCPGCGDYAILAQIQKLLPELGLPKENIVFISGIGCSSRFPYYMNTYGIHSIHGRAPTLATGLKIANPDLSVWVITGDGDGLSIGGNHMLHALRRNVDLNIILFNNRIYGLTKGQYSPTSPQGQKTKSSPMGTLENPLNPLAVAVGAEATFIARTIDTHVKHMAYVLKRAAEHKGTSFVEIYQNCVIFNDGAWSYATDANMRDEHIVELEDGQPLVFGQEWDKGIRLNDLEPEVVSLDRVAREDLLVHHEAASTPALAYMLSQMRYPEFPEPIGVFRAIEKPTYERGVMDQVEEAVRRRGPGDLHRLYYTADTWEIFPEPESANGQEKSLIEAGLDPREFQEVTLDQERASPVGHSMLTDTLIELKPAKPLTLHFEASLAEAIDRLQEMMIGFLVVVDDQGKLAGFLNESEVLARVACQVNDLSRHKVKEYMSTGVISLKMEATIAEALRLMATHQLRHIPIVDDSGRPEGMISSRSVVHYLEKYFAKGKEGTSGR